MLLRAETDTYARVGEATELALRVLAEKVGLAGYSDMPRALAHLGRRERATFCNDWWQQEHARVGRLLSLHLTLHLAPCCSCALTLWICITHVNSAVAGGFSHGYACTSPAKRPCILDMHIDTAIAKRNQSPSLEGLLPKLHGCARTK